MQPHSIAVDDRRESPERERLDARSVLLVAILSICLYAASFMMFRGSSRAELFNYHAYLAESFLNGSLALLTPPPTLLDLSQYNGKLYLYWGPMPAVVLMPLVYIFGVHWSDALLTVGLAALSTTLAFMLLQQTRRIHGLSQVSIALLTFTYGFGSPQYPLAVDGTVWFVSQLFTSVFLTSAMICVLREDVTPKRAALSGLFIGMACLTRASVIGAAFWLFALMIHLLWSAKLSLARRLYHLLCAGIPLVLLAAAVCWYNYARFGSVLETGVSYHQADPFFAESIKRYGIFSLHYLERNFYYHYLAYPFPVSPETLVGGSLFLLTPVYFSAFRSFFDVGNRWLVWLTWITCLLLAIPSLLVCGTGEVQLGPRYTLDYAPFFLVLVAIGLKRIPAQVTALLAGVSFIQYFYGLFAIS